MTGAIRYDEAGMRSFRHDLPEVFAQFAARCGAARLFSRFIRANELHEDVFDLFVLVIGHALLYALGILRQRLRNAADPIIRRMRHHARRGLPAFIP